MTTLKEIQSHDNESQKIIQVALAPQEDLLAYSPDLSAKVLDTKSRAGAEVVLSYFQSHDIGTRLLTEAETDAYQKLMMGWSKPWRVYFLQTAFTYEELQLIWEEQLVVQANSPTLLQEQEQKVRERLGRISPAVELSVIDHRQHYATKTDIEQAKIDGKLVLLRMENIISDSEYFTHPRLAMVMEKVDAALSRRPGFFSVSSSVRALELQQLLRKLGYPAALASYHTLIDGGAVDLKLSSKAMTHFEDVMSEVVEAKSRLVQVENLLHQGINVNIALLIRNGILPETDDLAVAYQAIIDAHVGTSAVVIDELPFFLSFDSLGKLKAMNPVLHIQHEPTN